MHKILLVLFLIIAAPLSAVHKCDSFAFNHSFKVTYLPVVQEKKSWWHWRTYADSLWSGLKTAGDFFKAGWGASQLQVNALDQPQGNREGPQGFSLDFQWSTQLTEKIAFAGQYSRSLYEVPFMKDFDSPDKSHAVDVFKLQVSYKF